MLSLFLIILDVRPGVVTLKVCVGTWCISWYGWEAFDFSFYSLSLNLSYAWVRIIIFFIFDSIKIDANQMDSREH